MLNKQHPQYQVWNATHRKSKDAKNANDPRDKSSPIENMEARVRGNSKMSVNEVLASAGVGSHRVKASMEKTYKEEKEVSPQLSQREQAIAVNQLIQQMKRKNEEQTTGKSSLYNSRRMVGRHKYDLPTTDDLRHSLQQSHTEQKRKLISRLAHQEQVMEGKITLKDYDEKVQKEKATHVDPVKEYVRNFSNAQDILGESGAKSGPGGPGGLMAIAQVVKLKFTANRAKQAVLTKNSNIGLDLSKLTRPTAKQ